MLPRKPSRLFWGQWCVIALMCAKGLSATEKSPVENTSIPFHLTKHTNTLNSKDHKKYAAWILSQDPSPGKKALLVSTATSGHYPLTSSITWYKAHISLSDFKKLLTRTYGPSSIAISTIEGNYDYAPNGAFWIDFANAQHFGGTFRSTGNVQEERMFFEFPQLANLAYALRYKKTILPTTHSGSAEPFLIVSLLRRFDVSKVPYGRSVDSASPKEVRKDIVRLDTPFKVANIIGLAALDYNKDHAGANHASKYSMKDLTYHLQASLLGDLAALRYNRQATLNIHTGRWGTGAFKNSLKMITAIQILAAEMAFHNTSTPVQLFFHGVDSSLLVPIQEEIEQSLKAGIPPSTLLQQFLARQDNDPSWRPQ